MKTPSDAQITHPCRSNTNQIRKPKENREEKAIKPDVQGVVALRERDGNVGIPASRISPELSEPGLDG